MWTPSTTNTSCEKISSRYIIVSVVSLLLLVASLSLSTHTLSIRNIRWGSKYGTSILKRKDDNSPCAMVASKASSSALTSNPNSLLSIRQLLVDENNNSEVSRTPCLDNVLPFNREWVYIPSAKLLFVTSAKSGTTTSFRWLYTVTTGLNWDACETYSQNLKSDCWQGYIHRVYDLPIQQRNEVLFTDPSVMRIIVQRDPFAKLISAFKSKFSCENERFGTNLHDRAIFIPQLLRQCGGIIRSLKCMSIEEFASVLDACREKALSMPKQEGFQFLRNLDVHVRPQLYCEDEVPYDAILDVQDLSDESVMRPIWKLFPFRYNTTVTAKQRHISKSVEDPLTISENAAQNLHTFATLSQVAQNKYISGAAPSSLR